MVRYLALNLVLCCNAAVLATGSHTDKQPITLRAYGVTESTRTDPEVQGIVRILDAFRSKYPHINPVSTTGLHIPDMPELTMDVVPLMQIAGDIAPHVLAVDFRHSDTYIRKRFLYPLEKYIEETAGFEGGIQDGHRLDLEQYLARLGTGNDYSQQLEQRVPNQTWPVIRRRCPDGMGCPYLKQWSANPAERHYHIWALPISRGVMALYYRKDLFAEAGLPDRTPDNWQEMLEWMRRLTNPHQAVVYASLLIAAVPTFGVFVVCQRVIIRGIIVPVEK